MVRVLGFLLTVLLAPSRGLAFALAVVLGPSRGLPTTRRHDSATVRGHQLHLLDIREHVRGCVESGRSREGQRDGDIDG